MRNVFKIFKKIVKGYLVLNTLCWAFIGSGIYLKRGLNDKYKNKTAVEIQGDLLDESLEGFKELFKGMKKALKIAFNK